ncbi:hypothetical protein [Sphingobacterium athyrii]|nr:hypothetical protein [Sphingobacterium athyrii]
MLNLEPAMEELKNQACILFRKDKSFELRWTGAFGYYDLSLSSQDAKLVAVNELIQRLNPEQAILAF